MSDFYTITQRRLQDEFDAHNLADLAAQAIVAEELTPQQTSFVEGRNMRGVLG